MKKLLSLFFVLLLLLPGVLAIVPTSLPSSSSSSLIETHTVRGDLQSFGSGIKSALPPHSDMGGFIDGMLGSMPLFGLIVIVFGLMFFITKITLFKDPKHDKYARMISFGVALMGLAQQKVYNTILSLSTTFLILSFILAIVFMFIMFVNHNRKEHLKSHTELHEITGNALSARRSLEKIKHELNHEKNLYDKTDHDLATLDSDLDDIDHLVGNEITQIDKLGSMLRKATAAQSAGNSAAVKSYVNSLSKDLAGLITTMKHEHKEDVHIGLILSKIKTELARWDHGASKDMSEEQHLKHLLKKLSQSWGLGHNQKDFDALHKVDNEFIHLLRDLRKHLHELDALDRQLNERKVNLDKFGYERKHSEANNVRSSMMNQQFTEAHTYLDNLRALIEQEPHLINQMKHDIDKMHTIISKIDSEEKKLIQLLRGPLAKSLKKARADVKDQEDSNPLD